MAQLSKVSNVIEALAALEARLTALEAGEAFAQQIEADIAKAEHRPARIPDPSSPELVSLKRLRGVFDQLA